MAPSITNYAEIQHDEIEALRSIYMEDFVEIETKTGAWNKAVDRAFKIHLRAPLGEEQNVTVALNVSLPATYPKSLPRLDLAFGEEIHSKTKAQAEEVVRCKPKTLVGSEMIYEIATSLQDILDNLATGDTKDVPTLDEERAAQGYAAKVLSQQAKDERRRLELQAEEEERKLLLQMVDQERNRSARHRSEINKVPEPFDTVGDLAGVVKFEQSSRIKNLSSGKMISIDAVYNKVIHAQGPVTTVYTVQPYTPREAPEQDPAVWTNLKQGAVAEANAKERTSAENPPFLVLKECHISSKNGHESLLKRGVQNLESKLEYHMRLKPHQSILKLLNFRIQRHAGERAGDEWIISILTELASKKSLQDALEIVDKVDIKIVRAWSIRLIDGLQNYHRHGTPHAAVRLSNILLEQDETKKTVAKLSDGGFQRDLHLLKKRTSPSYFSIAWTAPETNINTQAEAIPATDIWDFGICFLQMAFGLEVMRNYQSPATLLQELKLSCSLKALLSQVFNNDPKKRPSAWDLLHFEFFRNEDALLEEQQLSSRNADAALQNLSRSDLLRPRRGPMHASTSLSRYEKEFVEEGRLGRGGFGEVFRARNKTDGQPYAIKKIKAQSRAALDPVLSEVTVLSRLNHPNVVRYYASWIDDSVSIENHDDPDASEDEYSIPISAGNKSFKVLPTTSRGLDFISSTNAHIVFGNNMGGEGLFANVVDGDGFPGSSGDEETTDEDTEDCSESSESPGYEVHAQADNGDSGESHLPSSGQPRWTILYIQMEYCKPEVSFHSLRMPWRAKVLPLSGHWCLSMSTLDYVGEKPGS